MSDVLRTARIEREQEELLLPDLPEIDIHKRKTPVSGTPFPAS